ncbi:MAG: type II toxin-antitoxin system RelE/ParE family toxin [Lachnospiraceae bacterium]|jgi:plasmid stabilization system protein ParE|nr:type II toxin-antitoxin system RelE/ParE family toxin [Lachnospiraceae bacterium]
MNLSWTQTAKSDLQGIWDYIARDSVFYADKFIDKLLSVADVLEDYPEIGRIVPEIGDPSAREIIYRSYRIMYLIQGTNVYVTQITHAARNFKPD